MTPVHHPSNNLQLGPPSDWDPERDGLCITLHCTRAASGDILSFWKPSPEELAHLNANGHVVLSVVGVTMQPVWLGADVPQAPPDPSYWPA